MINITYANFHNNENKIQNNTSSLDILRYPNDKIGRVTNMKVYNFDKVISRDGTYGAKYNNKGHDIIPLSVADMDIPVADFIVSELSVANRKVSTVIHY